MMIYGVVMAGGKGERFWPLSRMSHPKQLLSIISERSMLQDTIDRVVDFIPIPRIRVVSVKELADQVLESVEYLKEENLISEPFGRNTCMAIGLAAAHLYKSDNDAIMVVLSCDHYINPREKLVELLNAGCKIAADKDYLITIGISPTRAETAYGYIERGDAFDRLGNVSVYKIASFKEKPDKVLAQQYYYSRKHLWNSGMFIWSANSILEAIRKHQPMMGEMLDDYMGKIGTDQEDQARLKCYENCEKISIDIAILERAENVLVIEGEVIWDDVGSWQALERIRIPDSDNNVIEGNVFSLESYENTIYNSEPGIISVFGVSDLVIVRSGDIVLVTHKSRVDEIGKVVSRFREDESLEKYT
jgi:mannose-1-phosphate guanylyltransferase